MRLVFDWGRRTKLYHEDDAERDKSGQSLLRINCREGFNSVWRETNVRHTSSPSKNLTIYQQRMDVPDQILRTRVKRGVWTLRFNESQDV